MDSDNGLCDAVAFFLGPFERFGEGVHFVRYERWRREVLVQFPEVRGVGWPLLDAALQRVEDASAQVLSCALHVARGEVGEHFSMQFLCYVGEFPGMGTGSVDLPPEDKVPRRLHINFRLSNETVSMLYLQHHIFPSLNPSYPLQLQSLPPIRPPTRSLLAKRHNKRLGQ